MVLFFVNIILLFLIGKRILKNPVEAAFNRDYTMILGTTIFFSTLIIFFNLLSDIAVLLMNPRARSQT